MPQSARFRITVIDNHTNITQTIYAPSFISAQRRASRHLIDSNTYAIIEEIN